MADQSDAIAIAGILGVLAGCVVSNVIARVDRYLSRRDHIRYAELNLALMPVQPTPEDRDAAVLRVLLSSVEPIGPTEIARRIKQPWALSNVITPILRRINAQRLDGGLYMPPTDFYTDRPQSH